MKPAGTAMSTSPMACLPQSPILRAGRYIRLLPPDPMRARSIDSYCSQHSQQGKAPNGRRCLLDVLKDDVGSKVGIRFRVMREQTSQGNSCAEDLIVTGTRLSRGTGEGQHGR